MHTQIESVTQAIKISIPKSYTNYHREERSTQSKSTRLLLISWRKVTDVMGMDI